jgi:hypothetical protein
MVNSLGMASSDGTRVVSGYTPNVGPRVFQDGNVELSPECLWALGRPREPAPVLPDRPCPATHDEVGERLVDITCWEPQAALRAAADESSKHDAA